MNQFPLICGMLLLFSSIIFGMPALLIFLMRRQKKLAALSKPLARKPSFIRRQLPRIFIGIQIHRKLLIIAGACFLALLYLIPLLYIFLVPARRLPQEGQPSTVDISEGVSHNILWRTSDFSPTQFSNEPYPATITCGLGEASCQLDKVSARKIRTFSKADNFRLYQILYAPVILLASSGIGWCSLISVIFFIGITPRIRTRFGNRSSRVIGSLVILFIAITYLVSIVPKRLSVIYSTKRPLVSSISPPGFYLKSENIVSGFSAYDGTIMVINGKDSPIDLYVDGLWVDRLAANTYRDYAQYRDFSRFTSIDAVSHQTLDDITFQEKGSKQEIFVYNVQALDAVWVEDPPIYR